jgi:hypothetical protein
MREARATMRRIQADADRLRSALPHRPDVQAAADALAATATSGAAGGPLASRSSSSAATQYQQHVQGIAAVAHAALEALRRRVANIQDADVPSDGASAARLRALLGVTAVSSPSSPRGNTPEALLLDHGVRFVRAAAAQAASALSSAAVSGGANPDDMAAAVARASHAVTITRVNGFVDQVELFLAEVLAQPSSSASPPQQSQGTTPTADVTRARGGAPPPPAGIAGGQHRTARRNDSPPAAAASPPFFGNINNGVHDRIRLRDARRRPSRRPGDASSVTRPVTTLARYAAIRCTANQSRRRNHSRCRPVERPCCGNNDDDDHQHE